MMKFFRKYNKQLLAVVVVLLMFVFVGGTAFRAFISPNQGTRAIGSAYGQTISGSDQNAVVAQVSVLSRLGLPWNRPWSLTPFGDGSMPALTELDYLLLVREARRNGFQPDPIKARTVLAQLNLDLPKFRLDNKISAAHLETAVANFLMIQQMWMTAQQSARASELEVMRQVRLQHEKLKAQIVAIDSSALIDDTLEISDAEIQEQFDKYKDHPRGDEPLAFGYLIPDRVQVEYFVIDSSAIKPTAEVTMRMAEDYFSENRSQFRRPVEDEQDIQEQQEANDAPETADDPEDSSAEEQPGSEPPAQEQPADDGSATPADDEDDAGAVEDSASLDQDESGADENQPTAEASDATPDAAPEDQVETAPGEIYKTFAEAREAVFEFLREQQQLDDARTMAYALISNLRDPWFDESPAENGWLPAPPRATEPDYYGAVLSGLKTALDQPQCISIGKTELFSAEEAATIEPLGDTREDVGGSARARTLQQSCFNVQGLVDAPDPNATDRDQYLALYQTAPFALVDGDNNLYVYRVVQAEPAHAPESVDMIRDEVIADVRKLKAKQVANQYARALVTNAEGQTLQQAWEAYEGMDPELKAKAGAWFQANPFAREGQVYYFSGQQFEIPLTVTSQSGSIEDNIRSDKFIADTWQLYDNEGEAALGLVDVPDLAKSFAVQLEGVELVDRERYQQLRASLERSLTTSRVDNLKREMFSRENIRARTRFQSGDS